MIEFLRNWSYSIEKLSIDRGCNVGFASIVDKEVLEIVIVGVVLDWVVAEAGVAQQGVVCHHCLERHNQIS